VNNEKKEKLKRNPRQKMPEQDPILRNKNFNEVNLGYSLELAQTEAGRCLQCDKPLCIESCPVNVDIPGFIKLINEKQICEAAWKIKENNALPAICGRVCPQEDQCEGKCVLGRRWEPIAMAILKGL